MALMTLQTQEALVSVLVIRQSETYGCVYDGGVSPRLNRRVLNMAVEKAEQLWPGLPVMVLRPEVSDESEPLPPVQCLSLLQSDYPIQAKDGDISRLVLIHFEHELSPHFSEMTKRRVANTKWSEVATSTEL